MLPVHSLDSLFETIKTEFETARAEAAERSRTELVETLNQFFRRLRNYQGEAEWVQTTVDAVSPFCGKAAVFGVANEFLRLVGQTKTAEWPHDLAIPIASAGAFASAIESKETVTALRRPSEVSAALCEGEDGEKACLFPILNGNRVSAVLFASGKTVDMNALELITGIAESVLGRKGNSKLHAQIAAAPGVRQSVPVPKASSNKLPAWGDLPSDQRQLHIRAQRFARVTLAEIQLARPEACRAGRQQGDLYLFLKREIDKARESYRKQFMTVPFMVDYLHLELIQTAAEGDEEKLGVDYPGRLQ